MTGTRGVEIGPNSKSQLVTSNGHAIIGIIVIGVLFFQPFLGLLTHALFKKKGKTPAIGIIHRWIGRVFLVLGVINGGLGFQIAWANKPAEIAYGVVAGFFFLLWLGAALMRHLVLDKRTQRRLSDESGIVEKDSTQSKNH